MTKQAATGRLLRAVTTVTLGLAVLGTGCRAINRFAARQSVEKAKAGKHSPSLKWNIYYKSTNEKLDDLPKEQLGDLDFVDTAYEGDVAVSYQKGLADQAQCVASQVERVISLTEKRIGKEVSYKAKLLLIRPDGVPQNVKGKFEIDNQTLPFPLFVTVDNETCEALLSQSLLYPYLVLHELVEISLLFPDNGQAVLADVSYGFARFCNYTRWFREGFANYAGLVADEITRAEADLTAGELLLLGHRPIHEHPFSSLSKMGKDLFTWDQFTGGKKGQDGYNASLGLFLLIRDRYGPQAIRQIVKGLEGRGYLDGQDLIKICNEALSIDIVKMAGDFDFPDTGMETKLVTPAVAINKGLSVRSGLGRILE